MNRRFCVKLTGNVNLDIKVLRQITSLKAGAIREMYKAMLKVPYFMRQVELSEVQYNLYKDLKKGEHFPVGFALVKPTIADIYFDLSNDTPKQLCIVYRNGGREFVDLNEVNISDFVDAASERMVMAI